eukprot:6471446-Amphidinium_carterae.2
MVTKRGNRLDVLGSEMTTSVRLTRSSCGAMSSNVRRPGRMINSELSLVRSATETQDVQLTRAMALMSLQRRLMCFWGMSTPASVLKGVCSWSMAS